MGLDFDLLYPGRFMKSGEFEGKDRTLTIVGVRVEELEQDKGGVRGKGIITFDGEKKELVLNKTNGLCLRAMWGRETTLWLGKRVTLFPAPHYDNFTKTQGTAIRVRGSPDLASPLAVVIKLRKKKDTTMTLVRTGGPVPANGAAKPPPDPAKAELIRVRMAIKALLDANDLHGDPAVAFVLRITGKSARHDANDLALIQTALAAPPPDNSPPPPGDEDAPF